MLGMPIRFEKDWLSGVDIQPGEVVVLENCRGNVGEKKNDPELVAKMAALCDIYVNDAFAPRIARRRLLTVLPEKRKLPSRVLCLPKKSMR